jgi:hypothetical protein
MRAGSSAPPFARSGLSHPELARMSGRRRRNRKSSEATDCFQFIDYATKLGQASRRRHAESVIESWTRRKNRHHLSTNDLKSLNVSTALRGRERPVPALPARFPGMRPAAAPICR